MNSGTSGIGLPKWQMALLLGAPLAIGIGYLYMRKTPVSGPEDEKTRDLRRAGSNATTAKSLSLDSNDDRSMPSSQSTTSTTVSDPDKTGTPLERAIKMKNEGNKSFRNGKYNDAIQAYDKAIGLCPLDNKGELSTFYQNRAAAYEQLKKWSMVQSDCTTALELNPNYAKALTRRAKAHEALDELQKCLEDITATCILEGFRNDASLTYADRVLKKLGERNAKKALDGRDKVYPSHSMIKAYFASFSNDPIARTNLDDKDVPEFGFPRAIQLLDLKEYLDCEKACTQEIDMGLLSDPHSENVFDAYLLRGSLEFLTGQLDKALNDFNIILKNSKVDKKRRSNALVRRALVYAHQKQLINAIEDLAKAEQIDDTNSDIYQQRAVVYVQMDKIEEALLEMDRVIQLEPELLAAQIQQAYFNYRLAVSSENAVKVYASIQHLQRLYEKYSTDVECCNLLAQVLTEQQQYDKALPILLQITQMEPTNATAHVHLGLLYLQWNGDIEKAVDSIKEAIKKDTKCELAYETLGTIEVQRGRLKEAITLFEQALKLCRTEVELVHVYSLRDAAVAQFNVADRMGLNLERLAEMTFATA